MTTNEILIKDWRDALLPADATFQEAIRNLDESALQIVLVISPDGVLQGTVTDGDIRRGLLRGMDMQCSIESIMFLEPLVAPQKLQRESVLYLMQANTIHQLPIVDEEKRVVGLHLWDELIAPGERLNSMVIMAGGQGTRLRPHTENCPKPLLLVNGKPMLEHIIVQAKSEGFKHFILAIHYLGNMIEDYFGDGSQLQVKIEYIREDTPLGTAGAISLMKNTPELPFIVTNGDVLTDIRYGELLDFHKTHNASATMAVRRHEWQNPFGVVRTKGVDIIGFEEKPISRSHINAGIYVLEPSVIDLLNIDEYCDMPTLFSALQEHDNRIIVFPMHEPWLDVGRDIDLQKANSGVIFRTK